MTSDFIHTRWVGGRAGVWGGRVSLSVRLHLFLLVSPATAASLRESLLRITGNDLYVTLLSDSRRDFGAAGTHSRGGNVEDDDLWP